MADTIGTINVSPIKGMPDEEWKRFCELVVSGKSNMQMVEELGRPARTIEKKAVELRKAFGVQSKFARKTTYTEQEDATIIELYAAGLLFQEIGERLGKSQSAIGSRIKVLRYHNPDDPRLAPRKPVPPQRKQPIPRRGTFKLPKSGLIPTAFDPKSRMEAKAKAEARFDTSIFDKAPKPHMAGIPFDRLTFKSCRYACNDADIRNGEEHLFCGADRIEGKAYCKAHLSVCEYVWRPAA